MPDYGLGEKRGRTHVQCICPKCRMKYNRLIFWTGNGTPRIFCDDCRENLRPFWYTSDVFSTQEVYNGQG